MVPTRLMRVRIKRNEYIWGCILEVKLSGLADVEDKEEGRIGVMYGV